jgi:PAS domain S-box-containing protein
MGDLLRRLEEAEETIRAIRSGDVDALLVRDAAEDRVFSVQGEAESYRTLMDALTLGAAAADADGVVLYANSVLHEMLDRAPGEVEGARVQSLVAPEAAARVEELLAPGGDGPRTIELRAALPHAPDRTVIVAATPMQLGFVRGFAITFTDMTDRLRAEASERSEKVALGIIRSANEAVVVCDRAGLVTHASAAAVALCSFDPVARPFADVLPLRFAGSPLLAAQDLIAEALEGRDMRGLDATIGEGLEARDFIVSAAPLQVSGAEPLGCVVTMVDVSSRKALEKQQSLLVRELDHRVKNTLALVVSISRRTMAQEETVSGFHNAFTQRIHALAATHNLLADKAWSALRLREIVDAELAPFQQASGERVSMEGLDFTVTPRAAVAFGLIVHELVTNAVKYGALSTQSGHVALRVLGRTAGGDLRIEWRESEGPEVVAPERRGFGHTVITRSLAYAGEGGADVRFLPTGLVCELRLPSVDVL